MTEELLSKNVKKIIKWGKGLSVFITKEAKLLDWDDSTYVVIEVIKDKNENRIVIKRVKI